ncbi:MAG: hypothetical protein HYR85_24885 [Planctomycetes bacterium]|nr:hypothetical protein [Planctomycetota bacterium]MBI3846085.1 hypothetical protein [Planctomycetota bacterium]
MSFSLLRVGSGVLVGTIGLLCGDAVSPDGGRTGGEHAIYTIPLKYAAARELNATLAPLTPNGGRILADPRSNTLIFDATSEDFARLRSLVALVDVPAGVPGQEPAARASAEGDASFSVNVAIVELTAQKIADLGVDVGGVGPTGLADAAARKIADLASRGADSSVTVHANVTVPVVVNKRTRVSRSIEYPTQTTSMAPSGVAQQGFGGYVGAENAIEIVGMPSGADAAFLEIQYKLQQPASTTTGPPVKTAQQGTLDLVLRNGDLSVTGGRLASESDASHLFIVVRLAMRK